MIAAVQCSCRSYWPKLDFERKLVIGNHWPCCTTSVSPVSLMIAVSLTWHMKEPLQMAQWLASHANVSFFQTKWGITNACRLHSLPRPIFMRARKFTALTHVCMHEHFICLNTPSTGRKEPKLVYDTWQTPGYERWSWHAQTRSSLAVVLTTAPRSLHSTEPWFAHLHKRVPGTMRLTFDILAIYPRAIQIFIPRTDETLIKLFLSTPTDWPERTQLLSNN